MNFLMLYRARADSAMRLVSQITLQAPTDWRAAAFLLERRFPDDYGKRTELTGKDGGPVEGGHQNSACLPAHAGIVGRGAAGAGRVREAERWRHRRRNRL